MINTFEKVNGPHPGFRRNHAKGVCVSGYFESNGRGVALSKAACFRAGRVPVIGRFALAGGQPYAADAPQTVRSMAILFKLPDGEEWRTAMIDIPVFAVKTAQAFHDQLLASAPDPATGKPDPATMKAFHGQASGNGQGDAVDPRSSGVVRIRQQHLQQPERLPFHHVPRARWCRFVGRWCRSSRSSPSARPIPERAGKNYLFDALIASIHGQPAAVASGRHGRPAGRSDR